MSRAKKSENLTGLKVGKLTLVEKLPTSLGYKRTMYRCKCECGNERILPQDKLKGGLARSCGCITPVYEDRVKLAAMRNTWRCMKRRCKSDDPHHYKYYKAKGITVCKEWASFKGFYDDMHEMWQKGMQLDRIKNHLGYFKDNCRWTTPTGQQRNKEKVKLNLEIAAEIRISKLNNTALAKKYNVSRRTIRAIKDYKLWKP